MGLGLLIIRSNKQTNIMSCKTTTKPCGSCPFSKTCEPGALGGSPITTYLGQICGPFMLPCHSQKGYKGNDTAMEAEQCRGAAIFRANIGVADMMPDMILGLPALSDPNVFPTLTSFIRHHVPDATDNKVAAMIALIPEFLHEELEKAKAKGRIRPVPPSTRP